MFDNLGFEVLVMDGGKPTRNKKLKFLNMLLFNTLDDLKYLQFFSVVRPKV